MKTIRDLLDTHTFLYAVLSSPENLSKGEKITLHPIKAKKGTLFQITTYRNNQVFHQNVAFEEALQVLEDCIPAHFKQALICTESADYHILVSKKQKMSILTKPPSKQRIELTHNRKKQYLLEEDAPIPFLISLGIMNREGKVLAAKRDKFRQLNRFLEMIEDILPHLPKKLHIIDFGCGKAYLTFALYHFLSQQGFELEIQGLDLKKEVINHCESLARELNYEGLHFSVGDINHFDTSQKVDMMISLHACDTATDAAIEKAVRWQAKVILCVPCCQHELFTQVKNEMLTPIFRHGILKERFAALATDAARAQLLEALGYHTQVLEFIDLEHTPKNLLIRAIKKSTTSDHFLSDYKAFAKALQIQPSLEKRFQKDLKIIE